MGPPLVQSSVCLAAQYYLIGRLVIIVNNVGANVVQMAVHRFMRYTVVSRSYTIALVPFRVLRAITVLPISL
jgi:hypothetical protein